MKQNQLTDQQFMRYERQIALEDIGEKGQCTLANSRVLMIGCGGLGSLVSSYLIGAGVGKLVIVDDDCIELSNLHRQLTFAEEDIGELKAEVLKRSLLGRNSQTQIRTISTRMEDEQLSLEVLLSDIVLDCSDNFATRLQLNRICSDSKTPLISGAAIRWQGQFAVYGYTSNAACYHCLISLTEYCGQHSEMSERCSQRGVIGPVVGVIASLQANAALQVLLGMYVSTQTTLTQFDGKSMTFHRFVIQPNQQCEICHGGDHHE